MLWNLHPRCCLRLLESGLLLNKHGLGGLRLHQLLLVLLGGSQLLVFQGETKRRLLYGVWWRMARSWSFTCTLIISIGVWGDLLLKLALIDRLQHLWVLNQNAALLRILFGPNKRMHLGIIQTVTCRVLMGMNLGVLARHHLRVQSRRRRVSHPVGGCLSLVLVLEANATTTLYLITRVDRDWLVLLLTLWLPWQLSVTINSVDCRRTCWGWHLYRIRHLRL